METITLTGRMNIQTGGGPIPMQTYAGAPGDVLEVPAEIATMARRMGYVAVATAPVPEPAPDESPVAPTPRPRPRRR